MSFDRGTFRVLPLTYFYLPKSASAYLFPNLSKLITFFAAAPLVSTPFVRNQKANPNNDDDDDDDGFDDGGGGDDDDGGGGDDGDDE